MAVLINLIVIMMIICPGKTRSRQLSAFSFLLVMHAFDHYVVEHEESTD